MLLPQPAFMGQPSSPRLLPSSPPQPLLKGKLLKIEPIEEPEQEEEDLEHEEENTMEDPQPADRMMHALASYANP
ncbi:hypothetical protein GW17_00059118 [Ensete ventricosum]|nr:hypothetical protein GW17_00059118 [Ensete ventricosum]